MDPITVGIVTNLLSAGLLEGRAVGRQRLRSVLQRAEFSEEIDAIETEFHRVLRSAIEEGDAGRETGELTGVTEEWDAVVTQLYRTSDVNGAMDDGEPDVGEVSDRLVRGRGRRH